jgi:hypothetical protein
MITLDFENFEEIEALIRLAKEKGLTVNDSDVKNFDAAAVVTIAGNSAQIIALLITIYQLYGNRNRVNYHSDNVDQDNLSIVAAAELAIQDAQ